MELIQNYGNQISEIVNEEQNLETQLDCALYAERYLDTLDQIASLNYKKMLRRDVADYFENNFKYGIHLWKWYKKNIEKIPETLLDIMFTKGILDPYDWVKEIRAKNQTLNWKQYYDDKEEADDDRWFYFRWWCNFEENV